MPDDYGYFGSGDEGYAHYVAASGEDRDPKGGSGGNKGGGFPSIDCFGSLMIFIFFVPLLACLINSPQ